MSIASPGASCATAATSAPTTPLAASWRRMADIVLVALLLMWCGGATVLAKPEVKCWGENLQGQLGRGGDEAGTLITSISYGGSPGDMGDNLPSVDLRFYPLALEVSAGVKHTCVSVEYGRILCLGEGPAVSGGKPEVSLTVSPLGHQVRGISSGYNQTCALVDAGGVKCYHSDYPWSHTDIDLGSGQKATQVSLGRHHNCALLDTGDVKCWGENTEGQLGYGDTTKRGGRASDMGDNLPVVDLGSGQKATQVSSGGYHTCALLETGDVKCWGSGIEGQLGYGDTSRRGDGSGEMGDNLPAVDLGSGQKATQVSLGRYHTCVMLADTVTTEDACAELRASNVTQTTAIASLTAVIETKNAVIEAKSAKNNELGALNVTQTTAIASLTAVIETKNAVIEAKSAKVNELGALNVTQTTAVASLTAVIETKGAEINELRVKISELETSNDTTTACLGGESRGSRVGMGSAAALLTLGMTEALRCY